MPDSKPLTGKVALITGGAKRLGRAAALALAQSGTDVAITFLRSEKQARKTVRDLESAGVRAIALRCDVTDPSSVRNVLKEVQWDSIFATNVRGPFLVSKEALPQLRKVRGKIINLGSLGGVRPWADHAHYCSSKAALHMLTKVMAKALAPEIAVNCVAPGMIDLSEKSAASFMKSMAKQTPMRRNGTAEDVSAAVLFFANAPSFITGQLLLVDGGLGL